MEGSDGIASTERLLQTMQERVQLLIQLFQLGQAYDAGQLSDGELLMGMLARKSSVIDRLSENQARLQEYAGDDPEARQWSSPARRAECQRLADDAQRILREIIDGEHQMLETLTMQRDAVAAQLQHGRDSSLAAHAYTTHAVLEQSSLDISD